MNIVHTGCVLTCSVIFLRVLFGSNHLYVFHHPKELETLLASGQKPQQITYDFAQGEIASSSGFDMTTEGKSKEDMLLQEDLIALMPMVYEANAISEELDKKVFPGLPPVFISPVVENYHIIATWDKTGSSLLEKTTVGGIKTHSPPSTSWSSSVDHYLALSYKTKTKISFPCQNVDERMYKPLVYTFSIWKCRIQLYA